MPQTTARNAALAAEVRLQPLGAFLTSRRNLAEAPEPTPSIPAADLFGYVFRDPALLRLALTHRSLAYESNPENGSSPSSDNEQLEFIGDAVLSLVVAEALYRRFPNSREGELTRLRASLVSSRNLAAVALRIDIGSLLRLGRGEAQSGGRRKPALLANALEAIIAALYLDGGLTPAQNFIQRHIVEPADADLAEAMQTAGPFNGAIGDYKSALQERLQASGAGQPQYVLTDQSGPDHNKHFCVEVRIADQLGGHIALAHAEGSTKKQAQQEAARLALAGLHSGSISTAVPEPA